MTLGGRFMIHTFAEWMASVFISGGVAELEDTLYICM
jgi:hypothetical protein